MVHAVRAGTGPGSGQAFYRQASEPAGEADGPVDFGKIGRCQNPVRRGGVRLHLLGACCTGNDRRDRRLSQKPGKRQIEDRSPTRFREGDQPFHDRQIPIGQ